MNIKSIFRFWALLLAICGTARAVAQLHLEASHHAIYQALVEPAQNDREVTIELVVMFTNSGDESLKLATGTLGPVVSLGANGGKVDFRYIQRKDNNGRTLIPSEVQLTPVVLNKGESTEIRYSFQIPEKQGSREFHVTYDIPVFLHDRFGVWCGRMEVLSKVPSNER
jgi:hypothetical protein